MLALCSLALALSWPCLSPLHVTPLPLQDSAALLCDLSLLHTEGILFIEEALREALAGQASAGVATLGAEELVQLVGALTPLVAEGSGGGGKDEGPQGNAVEAGLKSKAIIDKLYNQILVRHMA